MTRGELVAAARGSIEKGSKSFSAASRLFNRPTRERAWLLYCWCRHCDDVCDGQSSGFGETLRGNVSVLRGKTRQAIAGADVSGLPFRALAQLLGECPIPSSFIEDHLAGFTLDELGWHPETAEDLILYCYHVAGAVGCMMAILMGIKDDDRDTLERAADLGIAFQLSNIARDIADDARTGRCYIPSDWLAEFGCDRHDLLEPANRRALTAIAKRLVDCAELFEASARKGVAKLPFRSRLAVLAALRIYGAIGRRVRSLGPRAWDRRVSVSKAKKLALLVPTIGEAALPALRLG